MPIDPDYVREERIKRLRALVKSGTEQMLILNDEVPAYVRLGDAELQPRSPEVFRSGKWSDDVPHDVKRDIDIRMGFHIAEKLHGTYSKIYKWIAGADNGAARNLNDELYVRYQNLPSFQDSRVDTRIETPLEGQLLALASAIEGRVRIFRDQLSEDSEHEDISAALRDASGGWPHLRRSGLLSDAVLDGYLARMRKRTTKSQISDSIGSAKEVTEATMKGLAAKHGALPVTATPDLSDYWKLLRPHLADASIDKSLGSKDGAVLKLISAQVSTIQTLGELRNRVGTGHGRQAHPAGLKSAHALLAVDTAHSITRFLAG